MRRIYLVDLGLLVAVGTLAIVLTSKSAASEPNDAQEQAAVTAVPEASAITSWVQESSAEWISFAEDDPGSQ